MMRRKVNWAHHYKEYTRLTAERAGLTNKALATELGLPVSRVDRAASRGVVNLLTDEQSDRIRKACKRRDEIDKQLESHWPRKLGAKLGVSECKVQREYAKVAKTLGLKANPRGESEGREAGSCPTVTGWLTRPAGYRAPQSRARYY